MFPVEQLPGSSIEPIFAVGALLFCVSLVIFLGFWIREEAKSSFEIQPKVYK